MEHSDHARKSPPSVLTLSEPILVPDSILKDCLASSAEKASVAACTRWLAEPIPDVSVEWCVENLLTQRERSDYGNKFSNEDARYDWLLGRLCAKETVRELVFNVEDVHVPSNEIEIRTADDGSPSVHFVGEFGINDLTDASIERNDKKPLENSLFISITHSRKRAYVLAVYTKGTERPGIDCEMLREAESGMTELVFEGEERNWIEQQPNNSEKNLAFFRLWTAREAILKATNSSDKRPFELLAVGIDHITVKHKGEERKILTLTHEDYVVALCIA